MTRRWPLAAVAAAGLMATAVCLTLLRIPVQVTDSLVVMLQVLPEPSAAAAFSTFLGEDGFLRPLYNAQVKLLLDVSGGNYYVAYKTFHVLLVAALFALFVRAARVENRTDLAAFVLSLTVLTGIHTFTGTVWEAYPINHYLQVAVFCLGAFVLADSRGGLWADLLAPVLFAAAALTLESGLLVWVVFVSARLVGLRGVSSRGVALVSLCLIAYLYFRFVMLNTGSPTVTERSTGFGFDRLDPDEVVARFGMTPYALYAYNVAVSCFSVLLSEPRGGTWELAARLARGQVTPAMMVTVASVVTGTGLLAWVTVTRARLWLARRFERVDQVLLVFLAVLGGNAAICYVYTKDEVMSTAGVFYALAVFAGARELLRRVAPGPRPAWAAMALAAILFAGAGAWAIRSLGLHYHMIQMAFSIRLDWVGVDEWLADQKVTVETPEQRQLVATLRDQALQMPVENQYFLPRWGQAWFR